MKNLKKLGKVLSTKAQKNVNGGKIRLIVNCPDGQCFATHLYYGCVVGPSDYRGFCL